MTVVDLNHFERALEALALECAISDMQMFNLIAMNQACIAAEREACAKVADAESAEHEHEIDRLRCRSIAAAIRSRGQGGADV